jgi:hypothetical protein
MATRPDLRNVAIIAHVDHGKTTLVDAMLWQSGVFRANQDVADRVMDSGDLEREKGITILAKNTAVTRGDVTINVVDTPGTPTSAARSSARCRWWTGRSCSSTRRRARCPRPGSCCARRSSRPPAADRGRQQDRPAGRADRRRRRRGVRPAHRPRRRRRPDRRPGALHQREGRHRDPTRTSRGPTSSPCSRRCSTHIPAPEHDPEHPFQALVTNLDASAYVGRLALCRIQHGTVRRGQTVAWCREDGTIEKVKLGELYLTEALDRVPPRRPAPATSSRSPASTRSRSATRSPTPTTRVPLPA